MQALPVSPDSPDLITALEAAHLPTEDLSDGGRVFFAFENEGRRIGFGGFELYGDDALLRSVVVLPGMRGKGIGRDLTEAVLACARYAGARRAWLFTNTAEAFFERRGFLPVDRAGAPASILATRQATTICSTAPLLMRPLASDD